MMELVDLRSDILTRPTQPMLRAMDEAARARPAFGLREDPYVAQLEAHVARLLGTEDALFCPTCTQANQIAIHLHCRSGDLVAAESESHVFTSEAGAPAALSGVMPLRVPGRRGVGSTSEIEQALGGRDPLRARVAMLLLENTHVRSGGCVVSLAEMRGQRALANRYGVALHIDGARLPNAAIALNESLGALAQGADTVSLSLNKGLGAPLGAVLAGSAQSIAIAERVRQRFGGGWRPAGIPAAMALAALHDWEVRIEQDHRNARVLADGLLEIPLVGVDLKQVQTNIVLAKIEGMDASALAAALADQGLLVLPYGMTEVRLVTYHDIGEPEIAGAIRAFELVASGATSGQKQSKSVPAA